MSTLIALQYRSFLPEPAELPQKTPPSQQLSPAVKQALIEGTTNDPWKILVSDLTPAPADTFTSLLNPPAASEVDKGMLFQLLFNDTFCHWSDWHVCSNVGLCYNNATLLKWVVHTTCPDQFLGKEGPAPPGCVSTSLFATYRPAIGPSILDQMAVHLSKLRVSVILCPLIHTFILVHHSWNLALSLL